MRCRRQKKVSGSAINQIFNSKRDIFCTFRPRKTQFVAISPKAIPELSLHSAFSGEEASFSQEVQNYIGQNLSADSSCTFS